MENKNKNKEMTKEVQDTTYTKEQLNFAIKTAVKLLAETVKDKLTKEIILIMIAELKQLSKNNVVTIEQIENIGTKIIQRVESSK